MGSLNPGRVCQGDCKRERWQRAADDGMRTGIAEKQGNACGVKVRTVCARG